MFFCFFKQKTAYELRIRDWSSDVCSSDLLDIGKRDTLIVFDYRRYQTDVVEFARQAQARGAPFVLFTDPWMSPIAEIADVVIIASVEVDSPSVSLAPAVAHIDALAAPAVVRDKGALERTRGDHHGLRRAPADPLDEHGEREG